MNFSSYQNNLIEKIELALSKNKKAMINDFKLILNQAKSLYKTNDFDFWLKTIGETEFNELPVTKYGHSEALGRCKYLRGEDRNEVKKSILYICESLFTYSHEDENCKLSGIYHFYYSLTDFCIFKESDMGTLEGVETVHPNSFRIAYVSQLDIQKLELYV